MFLELSMFRDLTEKNKNDSAFQELIKIADVQLDKIDVESSPRLLHSHLPPHLLPKQIWSVRPKVIYIYRNPKDAAISRFHMTKNH